MSLTVAAAAQESEKSQSEEMLDTLPSTLEEGKIAIPLVPIDKDRSTLGGLMKNKSSELLYLHVEVRGQCAWFFAKHEHQAYVTKGKDGPRTPVQLIQLHSNIGGDRQTKECKNTEWCARTEEEYNLGCRRSCVSATAVHNGSKWGTNETCIW